MGDDAGQAQPDPRGKCDHICLKDGEHVDRGERHFYGYEVPSPRVLAAERDALRSERDTLFVGAAELSRRARAAAASNRRLVEALTYYADPAYVLSIRDGGDRARSVLAAEAQEDQ